MNIEKFCDECKKDMESIVKRAQNNVDDAQYIINYARDKRRTAKANGEPYDAEKKFLSSCRKVKANKTDEIKRNTIVTGAITAGLMTGAALSGEGFNSVVTLFSLGSSVAYGLYSHAVFKYNNKLAACARKYWRKNAPELEM